MNRSELDNRFRELVNASAVSPEDLDQFTAAMLEAYGLDPEFKVHIGNRLRQLSDKGTITAGAGIDLDTARAILADEIGFESWEELLKAAKDGPLLLRYAAAAMERGDFSALESAIGPESFDRQIRESVHNGAFDSDPETLAEIFAASCMLGYAETAGFLLDRGVDPYSGMRTGLAGPHWAASSGRLDVIKLLNGRNVPLEVENMYGGTVLGQALWSAVHEHKADHAAIIERLIEAGAVVEPGTLEWWNAQSVPDAETRDRVNAVLGHHAEFHRRVEAAKRDLADAEANGAKKAVADALKSLGNILRRPPFTRDAANEAYARAARLYRELEIPLESAWVLRHIGINHEYAERLEEAEKYYDESLSLFREHADEGDSNYANTVRYPAVIKNRLDKRAESTALWEEAVRRYDRMGQPLGVAEGAAWLAIFAHEKGDKDAARTWLAKAGSAASEARDPDTDKWISEARTRIYAGVG